MLKGKKIGLYVTGGIAVYKVVDLMREFIKNGAEVRVAMTESAAKFVSPLTFQVLSKHHVSIDTFMEDNPRVVNHIHFADWADFSLIAPLTANTLAKLAHGIADNFVTSALLATRSPIFAIPAMNMNMYDNQVTKVNRDELIKRGVYMMEPDTGFLAEGYSGKGRFPEKERIIEEFEVFMRNHITYLPLKGKKVIVTAGGTKERIDPVRYITNDSSGKTGHAIAEAAWNKGADVVLITASSIPVPDRIQKVAVESAKEMHQAVLEHFDTADSLVMSAAVSDYTPKTVAAHKMKKKDTLSLEFEKNPDILKDMGSRKRADQCLVGFAAETEHIIEYAQSKLKEKNADMIVANDVGQKDRGFNVDNNEVTFITHTSEPIPIRLKKKTEIADDIVSWIVDFF